MNRIVVDTNIAFSAFLNINSNIGQILINGGKYYQFYSPAYIRIELIEHKDRIKEIGKLNDNRFIELFELILRNAHVLDHAIVPNTYYHNALIICENIDIDGVAFIAVADYIRGRLWTGDNKLKDGLVLKGYSRLINTNELYMDFIEKDRKFK